MVSSAGQLHSLPIGVEYEGREGRERERGCSEKEGRRQKPFQEHKQLHRLVLILKLVLQYQWYCLQLSGNYSVIRLTQLNLKHVQSLKFFWIQPSYYTHTQTHTRIHTLSLSDLQAKSTSSPQETAQTCHCFSETTLAFLRDLP